MDAIRRLREAVARVEALAAEDSEAARILREDIRPGIQEEAEQINHETQLALIRANGPDPEVAVDRLCDAAEALPGYLADLVRRLEKYTKGSRKALWVTR